MSICLNKLESKCYGTGNFSQKLQKYGNYSYCAGCINKYHVYKQVSKIYANKLSEIGYGPNELCVSCNKKPKKFVYSYDKMVDLDNVNINTIKNYITVYCLKCSKYKKNEKKYIKNPYIDDNIINKYSVFDTKIKEKDNSSSISNSLDYTDSSINNSQDYTDILGIETANEDIVEYPEKDDPLISTEPTETPILDDRVSKLYDAISKLNLTYLLCEVCKDEEIYNRIMQKVINK